MSLTAIYVIWIAALVLKGFLVAVVSGKGMWKTFPLFSVYCAWSFLESIVLYSIRRHPDAYLHVYLVGESISILLGLAVVYEVFNHLLSMHAGLRRLATLVFRTVVILLILLAGAVIYARLPFHLADVQVALLTTEEAARVLEVGLLLFLFVFSGAFGLHWRQHEFGVSVGLGILAAAKLAVVTMMQYASSAGGSLNVAFLVSLDVSLLIWTGYLLVPERIASAAAVPDRRQLEQWNQAIMELIHQ
jgi:hypothetical protein